VVKRVTIFLLILMTIVGCSLEEKSSMVSPTQHPTTNETQGNDVTSETIIEPVIIAEGAKELNGNRTKETIRVWFMKGKEVTDPNPGAFQGTFLQGQFEVVATSNDGKELARFGLNNTFDGGELSFRKDKPFILQFDDYNGDGYPDFTIGQWGSSNGNIYSMLTIDPNGFRILEKNIYSSDHRGSIRYRKVGDHAFINQYYDQLKGNLDVIHRWKNGGFSLDAPIGAKEVHPAGLEDGEVVENYDPVRVKPSISAINPINEMSNQELVELKPVVKQLFIAHLENEKKSTVPAERRIKDFIVQDDIQILKNDQNTYFIVNYDTLAASKDFVVAGGGELNEDGWVKNRELHVVIQKIDGKYQIKQTSSGP
jgi:hypothetical protein